MSLGSEGHFLWLRNHWLQLPPGLLVNEVPGRICCCKATAYIPFLLAGSTRPPHSVLDSFIHLFASPLTHSQRQPTPAELVRVTVPGAGRREVPESVLTAQGFSVKPSSVLTYVHKFGKHHQPEFPSMQIRPKRQLPRTSGGLERRRMNQTGQCLVCRKCPAQGG